jgi:hypothetical protein
VTDPAVAWAVLGFADRLRRMGIDPPRSGVLDAIGPRFRTFHLRGDQDEIELWLGVDPEGYDAVTVTRQPVDGGTTAEGVVVLRGDLPRP